MVFWNLCLQNALWWLHECCMGFDLGRKPEHETLCFPCKVVAAGDERYLVCAAGAGWVRQRLGVVRTVVAASMCFVYSCTLQLHWVLESLLAKRIVMAAWMLHGVWFGEKAASMCFVYSCTLQLHCVLESLLANTHCNGCMNVAWGLIWGESRSTKPCIFPCKVVAAGDERYLVCAAGAGFGKGSE